MGISVTAPHGLINVYRGRAGGRAEVGMPAGRGWTPSTSSRKCSVRAQLPAPRGCELGGPGELGEPGELVMASPGGGMGGGMGGMGGGGGGRRRRTQPVLYQLELSLEEVARVSETPRPSTDETAPPQLKKKNN
eukprot:COSAG01_NODE_35753_length_527_cov_0.707944_1_plen_134_part_10